jgi:hypothetical protein
MKKFRVFSTLFLLAGMLLCSLPLQGQTFVQDGTALLPSSQTGAAEFPQWARDLRRAEIIAFGTFPFTMFTATFAVDTWRTSRHNWDPRYAPWPFKTAGAIEMTNEEHEIVIAVAGISSLALALTDFVIVQVKRGKARQRALQTPEGTPIIIKRPLPGAETLLPEEAPPAIPATGDPESAGDPEAAPPR